jgi:ParB family transcriptional regulator, chromosome partitioning protein
VLSADNTDAAESRSSATGTVVPVPVPVLSADNTTSTAVTPAATNHQGNETPEPADERSLLLVRQLGASVEEQARTLASGLPPEQLTQLIEELHAYV